MIEALFALLLGQSAIPEFTEQLVDDTLGDVWAMSVADVNADGKPDLLALNWVPAYVVWYENPTWKKRTLIEKEPRELVAIQPLDVDGDGKTEFILGAEYREPPDPKKGGGGVYLLRRPADLEQTWPAAKIAGAPTLHRVHPLDGRSVVCSALYGPTFVLRPPARLDGPWERETIAEKLSACHNTFSVDWDGDGKEEVLTGSREGLQLWKRTGEGWSGTLIARGNGGVSEIAVGRGAGGKRYLATIEPIHGAEFCVYTEAEGGWRRELLLVNKGGHTLWPADLTKTGVDSLLVGFVGLYSNAPGGPIWHLFHPTSSGWEREVLDDTKLPGEDGRVVDLDADGRPDCILAGGSRLKIHWNRGVPK